MKKAIILANVGTPDKAEVPAVYRYLTQFLNDKRVIDLPLPLKLFLVNAIIIPFRVFNSTKLYKLLWSEKGSPLRYLTDMLAVKLEKELGSDYKVYAGMRYGRPSLGSVMAEIKKQSFEEIIVLPMFPQYASSTSGTASEAILSEISQWNVIPGIRFIGQFYDHPAYIEAFVEHAAKYNLNSYDHFLFSYHGLPDSHINRTHPEINIRACNCEQSMPAHGKFCYKATCYETTRLLAKKLGIPADKYSVAFQSRLDKNWLTPFSDKTIIELAKAGKKKVLVFAPSFVTDCLETIIEIGYEYAELFHENGGEKLEMAEGLNDSNAWAIALKKIIED
jgi:protoporphyrin/coproporphyrin ferrochelatase